MKRIAWLALVGLLAPVALAREDNKKEKEDGFVPLFNGKNLDGWVRVNNAPKTFFVKQGEIVTTGKPTGFLRTAKQYENFILEMEWMHLPPKKGAVGNSGLFVWGDPLPALGSPFTRGIEVQVLVNLTYKNKKGEVTATSHGDIFSIWGATCVPDRPHPQGSQRRLPSENRAKGEGEWNHYRVVAKDGVIKLSVNGKEVSGVSKCRPRKGYLALEAEGSECHFRNLKIKELPDEPKPGAKDVADEAKGFATLFSGLDLEGWKAGEQKDNWKVGDNVLKYDGKAKTGVLATEKSFATKTVIVDVKLPKDGSASLKLGSQTVSLTGSEPGKWKRFEVSLDGWFAYVNGKQLLPGSRTLKIEGPIVLRADGPAEFMNLFVLEQKK